MNNCDFPFEIEQFNELIAPSALTKLNFDMTPNVKDIEFEKIINEQVELFMKNYDKEEEEKIRKQEEEIKKQKEEEIRKQEEEEKIRKQEEEIKKQKEEEIRKQEEEEIKTQKEEEEKIRKQKEEEIRKQEEKEIKKQKEEEIKKQKEQISIITSTLNFKQQFFSLDECFQDVQAKTKAYVNDINKIQTETKNATNAAYIKNQIVDDKQIISLCVQMKKKHNLEMKSKQFSSSSQKEMCRFCEQAFELPSLLKCHTCNIENISKAFFVCLNCFIKHGSKHKHKFIRTKEINTEQSRSAILSSGQDFKSEIINKNNAEIIELTQDTNAVVEKEITFKNNGKGQWKDREVVLDSPKSSDFQGCLITMNRNINPGEEYTFKFQIKNEIGGKKLKYGIYLLNLQLYNQKKKMFFGETAEYKIKIN